ncbi:ABC transporter substrate-binding protein [Paenibacillus cremeus]|uniref:ABC transporter substrate-binding protein n=1 Tax=Paenibacillus cremeus TaxID=2163881 RepID=A0A559K572_9BACL|nr:ABC transporter substrate-binding protein [Paenibacillus cremeus]TVY07243.1 ABC transporter substrate-binding protein [Paenibacillus cremeus]
MRIASSFWGNFRPIRTTLALLLTAGSLLSGCGSSAETKPAATTDSKPAASSTTPAPAPEKKPIAVTQVTNWFAQAEHGGNYTAQIKGFYKDAGLDMTITSGGPGISATQIVASGKAQFGMGQADEVLFARENGIPLVAIMAVFQKNPQGIMVHKGQNLKSMSDLNGHKVYVGSGVAYWEYMKKAFKLDKVEELKYTGQLANFVADKTSASQSYITSEPFSMKEQGVEVDVLLNADFGYNPYGNLMYTTESFLKENPQAVKAFVEATIKGWNYYKDNYKEINPAIKEKNPDMPLDKLDYSAVALQPLVFGDDAATKGVGYMSKDRWETLNKQLYDLRLLKAPQDVSKVFTQEFLPKK